MRDKGCEHTSRISEWRLLLPATTPLRCLAGLESAKTVLLFAARAVLCCHLMATAQRNGVVAGKSSRHSDIREVWLRGHVYHVFAQVSSDATFAPQSTFTKRI